MLKKEDQARLHQGRVSEGRPWAQSGAVVHHQAKQDQPSEDGIKV